MKIFFSFWYYLFVIMLCLIPVIWFVGKNGMIINGVDTNFPLDPLIWIGRRFFVWNELANGGADFSSSTSGIFFHFIQLLPYQLGFNLQQVQMFSFLFWFSLIIFASLILSRIVFPKKYIIQLLFIILYSFNVYIFNTWENSKVANLSLFAAIPLGISVLILLFNKKIGYYRAFVYSLLIGIVISGGGINPAYFLTFFLTCFIFLIVSILSSWSIKSFLNKLRDFLLLCSAVILLNIFWIIPTVYFILGNISGSGSIDKIGFTNWLNSLSENTSLLNVLRLQGAWDWYAFDALSGLPLYIPYALNYLYNPPFLIFSFIIPFLAVLSFIFFEKSNKSLYLFSGALIIIGTFLSSGTHPPTGDLFGWLALHVPFFSLFRSPWYIFTPILILAYAILIGLLLHSFHERFNSSGIGKIGVGIVIFILIIGNLIYSYPLVLGKIFRPTRPDSFYIKFPDYIFQSKQWLEKNNQGRIIGYPDDEIEQFRWGYRGIDSILNLIVDNETLFSSLNNADAGVSSIIREFYQNLKKNQLDASLRFAKKLNVSIIFEKKDQTSLAASLDSSILKMAPNQFGDWHFYKFPEAEFVPKIYPATSVVAYIDNYQKEKIIGVLKDKEILIDQNDSVVKKIPEISEFLSQAIVAKNSQYEDFVELAYKPSKLSNRLVTRDLSRASYFFEIYQDKSYQPILEKYRLGDFGLDLSKKMEIELDGKKIFLDIISSTDSYLFLNPIGLKKGAHTISFSLNNKNLINWQEVLNKLNLSNIADVESKLENDINGQYLVMRNRSGEDIHKGFPISSFDPLSQYLVMLKYKQIYGNNASVVIKQFNERTSFKTQAERLSNYPEWNVFSFYFEPVKTNSQLQVNLGVPSVEDPLGTKIFYNNLEVYKVFSNILILRSDPEQVYSDLPVIDFQKLSPTLYEGKVSNGVNPHIIVFSENYSPNWELLLFDNNGQKVMINPLHFSSNIYANAWYIQGAPQNYIMKINYKPQNLFLIGSRISLFTIVLVIGVGLWLLFKGKFIKNK